MKQKENVKSTSSMKIIRSKQYYQPEEGEYSKGVSLTVPDDSFTITELLERHQSGLGFGIQKLGEYDLNDEDEEHDALDMNQYQNLDVTEKELLHKEMGETKANVKKAKELSEKKAKEKPKIDNEDKPQ